jgi:putative PIN family toxin of toxin-antitoxin system
MQVVLCSSTVLLAELAEVMAREAFAHRIRAAGVSAAGLVEDLARLVTLVVPAEIVPTVTADPDDDHVLACALAAQADAIVSGDKRLRNLKRYQGIPIVGAAEALALFPARPREGGLRAPDDSAPGGV